jgi:hypothetical protein
MSQGLQATCFQNLWLPGLSVFFQKKIKVLPKVTEINDKMYFYAKLIF